MTQVGLKEDGRKLLDYMDGKRVAIDLSHSSDALVLGADFFGKISIPAFYQLLETSFGPEQADRIFYKNSHILINFS